MPNLNNIDYKKWIVNFTRSIAYSTKDVIAENMTNTSNILSEVGSAAETAKENVSEAIDKVADGLRPENVKNSKQYKDAMSVIKGAVRDIKTGDFAHLVVDEDSFGDDLGVDMGFDMNESYDEETGETTSTAGITNDAKLTATATIDASNREILALGQMTNTLGKSNAKSANAIMKSLYNSTSIAANMLHNDITSTNARLDVINQNIENLVRFNETQSKANEAALEHYARMEEAIGIAMHMYNKANGNFKYRGKNLEGEEETPEKITKDLLDYGFDFSNYSKMVKGRIKETGVESAVSLVKNIFGILDDTMSMGSASDMINLQMPINALISKLMPKKTMKSLKQLDEKIPNAINLALTSLGDHANDPGVFGTLARVLGIRVPSGNKYAELGNYNKGATAWSGTSQRALEEVIPGYLASIEKTLRDIEDPINKAQHEERHYDFDKGVWRAESQIRTDYENKMRERRRKIYSEPITTLKEKITDTEDNLLIDENDYKKLQDTIQKIVDKAVVSDITITKAYNQISDALIKYCPYMSRMDISDMTRMYVTSIMKERAANREEMENVVNGNTNQAFRAVVNKNQLNGYNKISVKRYNEKTKEIEDTLEDAEGVYGRLDYDKDNAFISIFEETAREREDRMEKEAYDKKKASEKTATVQKTLKNIEKIDTVKKAKSTYEKIKDFLKENFHGPVPEWLDHDMSEGIDKISNALYDLAGGKINLTDGARDYIDTEGFYGVPDAIKAVIDNAKDLPSVTDKYYEKDATGAYVSKRVVRVSDFKKALKKSYKDADDYDYTIITTREGGDDPRFIKATMRESSWIVGAPIEITASDIIMPSCKIREGLKLAEKPTESENSVSVKKIEANNAKPARVVTPRHPNTGVAKKKNRKRNKKKNKKRSGHGTFNGGDNIGRADSSYSRMADGPDQFDTDYYSEDNAAFYAGIYSANDIMRALAGNYSTNKRRRVAAAVGGLRKKIDQVAPKKPENFDKELKAEIDKSMNTLNSAWEEAEKKYETRKALTAAAKGGVKGGVLGSVAGVFLPTGPIGGAILGAAVGILGSQVDFKKALFGEKYVDKKGRVIGIKETGLIGQWANTIQSGFSENMRTEFDVTTDYLKSYFEDKVHPEIEDFFKSRTYRFDALTGKAANVIVKTINTILHPIQALNDFSVKMVNKALGVGVRLLNESVKAGGAVLGQIVATPFKIGAKVKDWMAYGFKNTARTDMRNTFYGAKTGLGYIKGRLTGKIDKFTDYSDYRDKHGPGSGVKYDKDGNIDYSDLEEKRRKASDAIDNDPNMQLLLETDPDKYKLIRAQKMKNIEAQYKKEHREREYMDKNWKKRTAKVTRWSEDKKWNRKLAKERRAYSKLISKYNQQDSGKFVDLTDEEAKERYEAIKATITNQPKDIREAFNMIDPTNAADIENFINNRQNFVKMKNNQKQVDDENKLRVKFMANIESINSSLCSIIKLESNGEMKATYDSNTGKVSLGDLPNDLKAYYQGESFDDKIDSISEKPKDSKNNTDDDTVGHGSMTPPFNYEKIDRVNENLASSNNLLCRILNFTSGGKIKPNYNKTTASISDTSNMSEDEIAKVNAEAEKSKMAYISNDNDPEKHKATITDSNDADSPLVGKIEKPIDDKKNDGEKKEKKSLFASIKDFLHSIATFDLKGFLTGLWTGVKSIGKDIGTIVTKVGGIAATVGVGAVTAVGAAGLVGNGMTALNAMGIGADQDTKTNEALGNQDKDGTRTAYVDKDGNLAKAGSKGATKQIIRNDAMAENGFKSTARLVTGTSNTAKVVKAGASFIQKKVTSSDLWITLVCMIGDAVDKLKNNKTFQKIAGKAGDSVIGKITKWLAGLKNLPIVEGAKAKLGQWGAKYAAVVGTKAFKYAAAAVTVAWDAISGMCDAANLFQVNSDDVDGLMKGISVAMKLIADFCPLADAFVFFAEIADELTGSNTLCNMATMMYNAIWEHTKKNSGKENTLAKHQQELEDEVDAYNAENGTNISVKAYNDQKNRTLGGKILDFVTGNTRNKSLEKNTVDTTKAYVNNTAGNSGVGLATSSGAMASAVGKGTKTVGHGSMVSQYDSDISNLSMGDGYNVANGGCGVATMANMLGMSGKSAYDASSGHRTQGGMTSQDMMDTVRSVTGSSKELNNMDSMNSELNSGKNVAVLGNVGHGGKNAHWINVTGKNADGTYNWQDPETGEVSGYLDPDQIDSAVVGRASTDRLDARVQKNSAKYKASIGKERGSTDRLDARVQKNSTAYKNAQNRATNIGSTKADTSGGAVRLKDNGTTIQNGSYYFAQNNQSWSNQNLSGFTGSPVNNYGCVMTSAAMGVSDLLGQSVDPGTLNSQYGNGNVGSTDFKSLGIDVQRLPPGASSSSTTDPSSISKQLTDALKAGKPVMLYGTNAPGKVFHDGYSTSGSHCVLATGIDDQGNLIVNNPYSGGQEKYANTHWPISSLNGLHWIQIMSKDGKGASGIGVVPSAGATIASTATGTTNASSYAAASGNTYGATTSGMASTYGAAAQGTDGSSIETGVGNLADNGSTIQHGTYYFAQDDSRWSGKTLTGYTVPIKNAGCVMTSAAMGASGLTGQAIDPGTFNSAYGNGNVGNTKFDKLGIDVTRYPSGGSMSKISDPSPYLDTIKTALQNHMPVMLYGDKTADNIYMDGKAGSAHCVIATGLDENGNVIINNPWSSAQKKYAQKTYPLTTASLNPFHWAQVMSKDGQGITSTALTGDTSAYSGNTNDGTAKTSAFDAFKNGLSSLGSMFGNLGMSMLNNLFKSGGDGQAMLDATANDTSWQTSEDSTEEAAPNNDMGGHMQMPTLQQSAHRKNFVSEKTIGHGSSNSMEGIPSQLDTITSLLTTIAKNTSTSGHGANHNGDFGGGRTGHGSNNSLVTTKKTQTQKDKEAQAAANLLKSKTGSNNAKNSTSNRLRANHEKIASGYRSTVS